MTDNRKAGLAMIFGSVGGIVTMAIHPTSGGGPDLAHLAMLSGLAHTLAIVSVLLLFLGAFGLTNFLAGPDRLAFTALVVFGMAIVAVLIGTGISGFVMPDILRMMARDTPASAPTWNIAAAAIFQINQAFSRIYSVASAVAITLWSIRCLKARLLARGIALYGVISAPLVAILIFAGHLRLNVHGMTVVMLSQAIWFVGIGAGLRRRGEGDAL